MTRIAAQHFNAEGDPDQPVELMRWNQPLRGVKEILTHTNVEAVEVHYPDGTSWEYRRTEE